jgi:hypothetical protein
MLNNNLTAFPKTEANLRELIKTIDSDRLKKDIFPSCSFVNDKCFGVCCSFKVAVTGEEAQTLSLLARDNKNYFERAGCHIPKEITKKHAITGQRYLARRRRGFKELNRIIYSVITDSTRSKTATMRDLFSFLHVCIFSMRDGGCSLQRLALEKGLHKWYYKPINCWKFPLTVRSGSLTIPQMANYVRLPCSYGKKSSAMIDLREELSFLGKIIGREIGRHIT